MVRGVVLGRREGVGGALQVAKAQASRDSGTKTLPGDNSQPEMRRRRRLGEGCEGLMI